MPTYYIFLYITYQGCIKGDMYQAVGEEKREGSGERGKEKGKDRKRKGKKGKL